MHRLLATFALLLCSVAAAGETLAEDLTDAAGSPAGFERVLARLPRTIEAQRPVPCNTNAPWACTDRGPRRRRNWRFLVAPYGWLAGVEGDVVSGGETTNITVPFEEFLDRTEGGFQIYAEARYQRFFLAFDGTWAQLGDEVDLPLSTLDITLNQKIYDVRLGYELLRRSLNGCRSPCDEKWRRDLVVDAYVGGRYWYTETILKRTGRFGGVQETKSDTDRWDPFVGARVGWNMTRRLALALRGDVGGFGIGDAAEFTWQIHGVLGYRVTPRLSILAGYRVMAFDTVTGSGAQRSGQDLLQHGPIVGVGFNF